MYEACIVNKFTAKWQVQADAPRLVATVKGRRGKRGIARRLPVGHV